MGTVPIVNTTRHSQYFDPSDFKGIIDIIGCGATGSSVGTELARYGFSKIRAWDFDKVENHNISNQKYVLADVGSFKVDALSVTIKEISGLDITTYTRACIEDDRLGEIVFLLTDSMSSRKEIAKAIRKSPTSLMIETRMGEDEGWIYVIRPDVEDEWNAWKKTLVGDSNSADAPSSMYAEPSACGGGKIVIGGVASMLAAQSVLYLIQYLRYQRDMKGSAMPPHETVFGVSPILSAFYRNFESDTIATPKDKVQTGDIAFASAISGDESMLNEQDNSSELSTIIDELRNDERISTYS